MVNGFAPRSLEEALALRAAHPEAIPYGGGTDLMLRGEEDAVYLFLNRVPEMKRITGDDEYVRMGGACTFTEILDSPLVPALMKEAASRIGAPAIRNAGTLAGNIGNGSAKADSALIGFVADARLVLGSVRGFREVDIADFYKGRKNLDLEPDELIVEILLPARGLENYYYEKVGLRKALAISRVSFAALVRYDGKVISHLAIAFGGVADTVLRFKKIEAMLVGRTREEAKELQGAFIAAYDQALDLTEGRVTAAYRRTVCRNLLEDCLRRLL